MVESQYYVKNSEHIFIKSKSEFLSLSVQDGADSSMSVMLRLLVLLCVVSSMALVLQLNLTNQHNLMLR